MGSRGASSGKRKKRTVTSSQRRFRFDIQFFAGKEFNPEAEREEIKSGYYSSKVSPQKQARHIAGTMEYERYSEYIMKKKGKRPSILYGDVKTAQGLIEKYGESGIIEEYGTKSLKVTIRADHVVGEYWDLKLQKYVPTKVARIIYTTSDAHIYPVWEGEWK